MKIHLIPQADGTWTIYIKRTLPSEGPSRSVAEVSDADRESVLERLVKEMRGEAS
jgi:hypothetical protein